MKCPKCKLGIIVSNVTVARALPLAKGGGVAPSGQAVVQKDLVDAHRASIQIWTSPRLNREEPYYAVQCNNEGVVQVEVDDPANPGQKIIQNQDAEFCAQPLWYFPSFEDSTGKAVQGRGLTWVGGRDLSGPEFAPEAKAAVAVDADYIAPEGEEVPAAGETPAAPVPAAPPARRRPPTVSLRPRV